VNIVIEDEIEFFKSYDDPEFNYPYTRRTSRMNPFLLSPGIGNLNAPVFEYTTYDIKFSQSITCLEGNPMGLFNPIKLY
jgi:hypothetical protein